MAVGIVLVLGFLLLVVAVVIPLVLPSTWDRRLTDAVTSGSRVMGAVLLGVGLIWWWTQHKGRLNCDIDERYCSRVERSLPPAFPHPPQTPQAS